MTNEAIELFPISEDNAEAQFDSFMSWYRLRESSYQGEQLETFELMKDNILYAVREGLVEVAEEQEGDDFTLVVYQKLLKNTRGAAKGDRVRYREIGGAAKQSIREERAGAISHYTKLVQFLGYLSEKGPRFFTDLKGPDWSLAENIGGLFLRV